MRDHGTGWDEAIATVKFFCEKRKRKKEKEEKGEKEREGRFGSDVSSGQSHQPFRMGRAEAFSNDSSSLFPFASRHRKRKYRWSTGSPILPSSLLSVMLGESSYMRLVRYGPISVTCRPVSPRSSRRLLCHIGRLACSHSSFTIRNLDLDTSLPGRGSGFAAGPPGR